MDDTLELFEKYRNNVDFEDFCLNILMNTLNLKVSRAAVDLCIMIANREAKYTLEDFNPNMRSLILKFQKNEK